MNPADLIHALRMWLPEGKSVAGVRDELDGVLTEAFADFQRDVPGSGIAKPAEVLPLAATAVARDVLQEALDAARSQTGGLTPSAEFKANLAQLSWPDLLLVAACANKNDAANRRLLEVVEREVRPVLAKKWGRDRAEEITDELPQKLHLSDERGLNRGRVRLLTYGGRSRLATWLRAVAHQAAIDRWRRQSREQPDELLAETRAEEGAVEVGDKLARDEDLDLVRRVGPQAFEQLMRQLPEISEQQYRFAYFRCVGGLNNVDIADRLGVAKSRITELSQQVFRRLITILRQLAPELESLTDEASPQRRRHVEEALQEWFGQPEHRVTMVEGGDDSQQRPGLRLAGGEQ
jgi:DNA-directed RNA polymerase specialized sigma24 family protein